jgi:hypothetical protein
MRLLFPRTRHSLNSFLSPTETASELGHLPNPLQPMHRDTDHSNLFDNSAFSGFPIGAEMSEEW